MWCVLHQIIVVISKVRLDCELTERFNRLSVFVPTGLVLIQGLKFPLGFGNLVPFFNKVND